MQKLEIKITDGNTSSVFNTATWRFRICFQYLSTNSSTNLKRKIKKRYSPVTNEIRWITFLVSGVIVIVWIPGQSLLFQSGVFNLLSSGFRAEIIHGARMNTVYCSLNICDKFFSKHLKASCMNHRPLRRLNHFFLFRLWIYRNHDNFIENSGGTLEFLSKFRNG